MELVKLVNAKNMIETFAEEEIGTHLAYLVAKFISLTTTDIDFYNNAVKDLVSKYATQDENGTLIIEEDKRAEFEKKVEELNKTEIVEPNIKFPLSELTSAKHITPKKIYPLLDFIDEEK